MPVSTPDHCRAELLTTGRHDAAVHILIAHGAGSPMTSPFLETLAGVLAARDVCVHRFEFAYMSARRTLRHRRPPPKAETLVPEYVATVWDITRRLPTDSRLLIGGKSLGGRVASLCANRLFTGGQAAGLVCFGYPFHPTADPTKLRTSHLMDLTLPVLILQGERDPFGNREQVPTYRLPHSLEIVWLDDGDHDFGPRGKSPATRTDNFEAAADAVLKFANLSRHRVL